MLYVQKKKSFINYREKWHKLKGKMAILKKKNSNEDC